MQKNVQESSTTQLVASAHSIHKPFHQYPESSTLNQDQIHARMRRSRPLTSSTFQFHTSPARQKTPPPKKRLWNQYVPCQDKSKSEIKSTPLKQISKEERDASFSRLCKPVVRMELDRDYTASETNKYFHAIIRGGSPPSKKAATRPGAESTTE
jgi:hypothetical protein